MKIAKTEKIVVVTAAAITLPFFVYRAIQTVAAGYGKFAPLVFLVWAFVVACAALVLPAVKLATEIGKGIGRGVSAFWHGFHSPRRPRPELLRYCTRCGAVDERTFYARGNWFICFVLCCCFLIPGIIYFVWMRSTEHFGCQKCGSPDIVPLDSPVGRRALETHEAQV